MKTFFTLISSIFIIVFLSLPVYAQKRDDTRIFQENYHVVFFKTVATLNELASIKSKTKEEVFILKHLFLKEVELREIGDQKFIVGKGFRTDNVTDWQINKTVMIKWELVISIVGFNNYEAFYNSIRNNEKFYLGN